MLRNVLSLAMWSVATLAAPHNPKAHSNSHTARAADHEGYAFIYFTGSNEQIYIAASDGNDALSFTELNGGQPILQSTKGDRGLRDPFVMRSKEDDKFFILATDLCIGCGTDWGTAQRNGSRHIEIWESPDLINFSSQKHVLVSPDNYGMTWAPEAYYDSTIGMYVVYWASGIYDNVNDPDHDPITYPRMVYATTDDFVTFSDPVVWQDAPPEGRIDSTIIQDNGVFHRFTKATLDGCADIVQESSTSLTATLGDWTKIASCIGGHAGTSEVEGPCIFKTNPGDVNGERFILLTDEYGGGGYVPLESGSLTEPTWTLNRNYKYPTTPRHGTIIPLTATELENIQSHYGQDRE